MNWLTMAQKACSEERRCSIRTHWAEVGSPRKTASRIARGRKEGAIKVLLIP